MRLKKGINVIMVPNREEAKEYGLGDDWLDVINERLFGNRPSHHIQTLDITNPEVKQFAEDHLTYNTIVYTYFNDISDLWNTNFTNLQEHTLSMLSNNVIVLFVYDNDYEPEDLFRITSKLFINSKYYDFLSSFMSINISKPKSKYSELKMRMQKYDIFNHRKLIINGRKDYSLRYVQSANFSDIFPINKYYCEAYISTKNDSFNVMKYIQACTCEDAEDIFVKCLKNIDGYTDEEITINIIDEISSDKIISRNKMKEMIEKKREKDKISE